MDLRTSYNEIRNDIKDCDILLYKGTHWLSKVIRWATKSPYSHAGVVVWWNNRLMVLEAIGKGVIVTPLSQNLRHYKGEVHLYVLKTGTNKNVKTSTRNEMLRFAQHELGKEYARWKMILFGIKILLSKDLDKKDELKRANKLYCSQYVAQIYNSGGFDLKKDKADRFMSPKDVAESPLLNRVK